MMKFWLIAVVVGLGLAGCTSQAIEQMNSGLSSALGQHVSSLEDALGKPAEVVREGNQTRYRWFKESHIEPCNVEVWADVEGLVRKTSWTGYRGLKGYRVINRTLIFAQHKIRRYSLCSPSFSFLK